MKNYNKEKLIFAIKDLLRDNKRLFIVVFCFFIVGFAIAAAIFGNGNDFEYARGRAIVWWLVTLTIFYALLFLSTFSKYLVFAIPAAFIYLGARVGTAAAFLTVAAGLKGFCNFITIYLPIGAVTFFLGALFIAMALPYLTSSPNCNRYPNCAKSVKSILKGFLSIFAINLTFALVWILLLGAFIDVIYVNPE